MARLMFLSDLRHDVTFALRLLRRSPIVTLTAVLTLGLGIGATTAIFSVVYAVLLQPLPYPAPDRLYDVHMLYPDGSRYSLSAPDFMSVRQDTRAFEQIEAVDDILGTLIEGEPREVRIARVSDGLFRQLGIDAVEGRTFLADEHAPGRGARGRPRSRVLDAGVRRRPRRPRPRADLRRRPVRGRRRAEAGRAPHRGGRRVSAAHLRPDLRRHDLERAAFGVPDRDRPRTARCRRARRQRRPAGGRRAAPAGVPRHERAA